MNNMLQLQKEKIISRAKWMAEQTNDWQMIREYLSNRLGDVKLTPRQTEKLKRYKFAYDQLSSGKYTEFEVINQLQKFFDVQDATAIQDIKHCRELFNITLAIDKNFEIKMQIELLKIEQQKARDVGNLDAYAKLSKCLAEFLKMAPEPIEQDEAFKPHHNTFEFNPESLGIPAIDHNELRALLATLKKQHGFNADLSFIEEAEIIEDDADQSDSL